MSTHETIDSTSTDSTLERAYSRLGHPIHRVRYGEYALIEEHVHVEAMTVRDGPANETVAKGLRFLFRAQPVEVRRQGGPDPDFGPSKDADFQRSWCDPVSEGTSQQRSVSVFVDLEAIDKLLAGFGHLVESAENWRTHEGYSTAEWREAVYAWNDALIFGLIYRRRAQRAFVESRVARLYFETSEHKLWDLRRWLKKVVENLQVAP
jgi:hypothetical protein